jgi:hypothetical protein
MKGRWLGLGHGGAQQRALSKNRAATVCPEEREGSAGPELGRSVGRADESLGWRDEKSGKRKMGSQGSLGRKNRFWAKTRSKGTRLRNLILNFDSAFWIQIKWGLNIFKPNLNWIQNRIYSNTFGNLSNLIFWNLV